MQVDVQSLGTFNQLAHEGAQAATSALGQLTGIDATVDVTRISLVDRAAVGEELAGSEYVGVGFDFEGGLAGETVLIFDAESADRIAEALLPAGNGDGEMARSGVEELGNIMMSGFMDGWADYLDTTIDHSPPTYLERSGADVLPEGPDPGERDQLFVFRSEIEWLAESLSFYIYMLPEYGSLASLLSEHSDDADEGFDVEKLEVFNRMTRQGTETAADHVAAMTGLETEAEATQLSFAPIEAVPKQVGTDTYVGTVVEFTGVPSGYLLVLFDEASAVTVAESLLPTEPDGEGLTEEHTAAIEELGNIMTSGFVDGWANVLQRSVDHTPPRLVHDMGRSILDPLAAQLGQRQSHAFLIDSTMRTEDVAFEASIHALPDEAELQEALDDLLVERADQTEADVDAHF